MGADPNEQDAQNFFDIQDPSELVMVNGVWWNHSLATNYDGNEDERLDKDKELTAYRQTLDNILTLHNTLLRSIELHLTHRNELTTQLDKYGKPTI